MAVPPDTQVLIVGAGPSGTIASLLLERLGIETLVVERRDGSQQAPAAHVVNARTFEICRAAGVDMKAMADAAMPPRDAAYAYFVTKLGGQVLGRLPFERQGDDQLALTPTPLRNLSQNRFEPIVQDALHHHAGKRPHWGQEWMSAQQDEAGIGSRIRILETGEEREIRSRYLIAADGAGSRIRKSLGIGVVGPDRIRSFIMVHLRAQLRGLPEIPPGVLFFVNDPMAAGVFVIHDLDREAVYMHPFDPETESPESYAAARCEEIVRGALADPELEFEIEHVSSWTMTAQVAERYRKGRIFLVGDAAHRFPPTGGLGLNSGVQDAHNLAWKIAAVEHGWGKDALLESYEAERRPVAQANADQSLRNALRLIEVPQALGVSEGSEASREQMQRTLADPSGLERVREAVARQAVHFDMPGLQLGFCYASGALVPDGEPGPEDAEDPRVFTPSARPGSRLPHAWVQAGDGRASLLDWVPLDRFLLLAGPAGQAWIDALDALDDVPIEGRLLDAAVLPGLDRWLEIAGLAAGGALLVRPDQHVAWRAPHGCADPKRALSKAIRDVLA